MKNGKKFQPTSLVTEFSLVAVLSLAAGLAACGGGGDDNGPIVSQAQTPLVMADSAQKCSALRGTQIAASEIGLPSTGAIISDASLQAPDANTALPEFCRVQGAITATNAASPPIKFEVNLPTSWNRKALQLGGGGFNGTLITGLDNVVNTGTTGTKPLARGYVTFGSDSGHTGKAPFDGSFALDAQALANYSGESVKRTHDAALAVALKYYQANPLKVYYAGGSKGGQESLAATQRYGADYDGVIAYYPANQNQALVLSWYRMFQAAYRRPGGALNTAKQQLLKNKVLETCDALDGVTDGIVSNLKSCATAFSISSLRCPDGTDTGNSCLSDTQISTLTIAGSPMQFVFPLANGITNIGAYPVFNGGDIASTLFDPAGVDINTTYFGFTDQTIRYFIQQSASSSSENFDYRNWQPRVLQISQTYDSSDPNMDVFRQKGGKLILVQGTTDMLVPHTMTTAYFQSLSARYGAQLPTFAKYYVQPGFGHGSGTFQMGWDALSALESWAEKGQAPTAPIAVDQNTATKGRSRPLCEYPLWPKYIGTGSPDSAANFTCVSS